MDVYRRFHRQLSRILFFKRLFPLRLLAKNVVTLPLDYVSPSGRAGPPMVINILITHRCDLKCRMCYAEDLRGRSISDMSPGDVEHIVKETLPFRPTFFLSGGEPCARSDIEDVVAVIKKHDLPLGMVSNAMQLTPQRSARFKSLGLEQIVVSLHGPEEIHDRITGIPGSFRKATANIAEMCRGDRKTEVMLNLVVSREILDSLPEMVELGQSLGVDRVRFHHLLFMTREEVAEHEEWCHAHLSEPLATGLEPTLYFCGMDAVEGFHVDVPRAIKVVTAKYGDFVIQQPDLADSEVTQWYSKGFDNQRRCLFVWRSLFIDPEGFAIPCQHYGGMKFGNVLERPFMEVWNSPEYRRMRRTLRKGLLPACSRCCKL